MASSPTAAEDTYKPFLTYCRIRDGQHQSPQDSLACSNNTVKYRNSSGVHSFFFDDVFDSTASQQEVYDSVAKPFVRDVLKGVKKNATIMCYGQTSSGKTHTMLGPHGKSTFTTIAVDHWGLVPRTVVDLLAHSSTSEVVTVRMSFVEIHNNQVFDLLDPKKKRVVISQAKQNQNFCLSGCAVEDVTNVNDILSSLSKCNKRRSTFATASNPFSSRSHAILYLRVGVADAASGALRTSSMRFVDLAGHESLHNVNNNARFKEGREINSSLAALNLVMSQMSNKMTPTFRGCVLVKLLKESLTRHSSTAFVVCCTPVSSPATKLSLEFVRWGTKLSRFCACSKIDLGKTTRAQQHDAISGTAADQSPSTMPVQTPHDSCKAAPLLRCAIPLDVDQRVGCPRCSLINNSSSTHCSLCGASLPQNR